MVNHMQELLKLQKIGVNILEHYKTQTQHELRYAFKGQMLPKIIQDTLKRVMKNHEHIHEQQTYNITDEDKQEQQIYIQKLHKTTDNKWLRTYDLAYDINNTTQSIIIKEIFDPRRGKFPIWSVLYNTNEYRQIPYNGNVYIHSHYQQDHIENCTSIDMYNDIITPYQWQLLRSLNPNHDLPEIIGADTYDPEKTVEQYDDESGAFIKLINEYHKLSEDTPEHIDMLKTLLTSWLDKSGTLFKLYERINYMNDAVSIYKTAKYYNYEELFAARIIANYIPKILEGAELVHLPTDPFNSEEHIHPGTTKVSELASIDFFFQQNKEYIDAIHEHTIRDFDKKYLTRGIPADEKEHVIKSHEARKQLKKKYIGNN